MALLHYHGEKEGLRCAVREARYVPANTGALATGPEHEELCKNWKFFSSQERQQCLSKAYKVTSVSKVQCYHFSMEP